MAASMTNEAQKAYKSLIDQYRAAPESENFHFDESVLPENQKDTSMMIFCCKNYQTGLSQVMHNAEDLQV